MINLCILTLVSSSISSKINLAFSLSITTSLSNSINMLENLVFNSFLFTSIISNNVLTSLDVPVSKISIITESEGTFPSTIEKTILSILLTPLLNLTAELFTSSLSNMLFNSK